MKQMTATEASTLLNQGEIVLIDVREQDEYETEHVEGSHHVPLSDFVHAFSNFELTGNKPLVVMCLKGGRSAKACEYLLAQNLNTEILNLEGGITAWKECHLPTVS